MSESIRIAQVYSRSPAGRYRSDGPYSGQRFREEILAPAFQGSDETIEIDLTGVLGFGSSFLDEAFAGLIREGIAPKSEVMRRLKILSPVQVYKERIFRYIQEAQVSVTRQ